MQGSVRRSNIYQGNFQEQSSEGQEGNTQRYKKRKMHRFEKKFV